jgi:predicted RNase H-related nuclease YkuK (DUF458 family)
VSSVDPLDIDKVTEFIRNTPENTKVYIGTDSERYKRRGQWWADYTLAVVVHIGGRHGCKVFGEIQTQKDYEQSGKKHKPNVRLMNEVYLAAELYFRLAEVLAEREVEIHLDLNPEPEHASNSVVQQAIGYIRGTCNMTPIIKPYAYAASYAADRLKEILT